MDKLDIRKDAFYRLLIVLRDEGKEDYNISLFLGIFTNDLTILKKAIDDGASINITDAAVINYHRGFLQSRCPELLEKFDGQNKVINQIRNDEAKGQIE